MNREQRRHKLKSEKKEFKRLKAYGFLKLEPTSLPENYTYGDRINIDGYGNKIFIITRAD
jgi:hypothetical protein